MTKAEKLIARMRNNPAGDWTIADVQRVCAGLGWACLPPMGGGSHWKVEVPGHETILTVPAHRPIRAVYIRKLMEAVKEHTNDQND
jgi:hypothetical protein